MTLVEDLIVDAVITLAHALYDAVLIEDRTGTPFSAAA